VKAVHRSEFLLNGLAEVQNGFPAVRQGKDCLKIQIDKEVVRKIAVINAHGSLPQA
jgi:hypothetical protein